MFVISPTELGRLFTSKRLKLDLTQSALAKRIRVTERTVRNWEAGKAIPNLFDGLRCCKALNINPLDLINRY